MGGQSEPSRGNVPLVFQMWVFLYYFAWHLVYAFHLRVQKTPSVIGLLSQAVRERGCAALPSPRLGTQLDTS